MSDLNCVKEQVAEIRERVASTETKVDTALELLREHRSAHLQYSLISWGAALTAIGAIVVALLV